MGFLTRSQVRVLLCLAALGGRVGLEKLQNQSQGFWSLEEKRVAGSGDELELTVWESLCGGDDFILVRQGVLRPCDTQGWAGEPGSGRAFVKGL